MIMKVSARVAEAILKEYGVTYFTREGIRKIIDFYDEDEVFDPIQIGSRWTEYGSARCVDADVFTFDDFWWDYRSFVKDIVETGDDYYDKGKWFKIDVIEKIIERLSEDKYIKVFRTTDGNILVYNPGFGADHAQVERWTHLLKPQNEI